ncbi:YitT family protein [Hydrogenophaga soli]
MFEPAMSTPVSPVTPSAAPEPGPEASSPAVESLAAPPVPPRHRPHEDVQALLAGTLFVALGVVLFRQAGLLTGGTAGIAFVLHYATGWNFSAVFFAINLPFYALAWRRMGRAFTLKTLSAVTLLSVFAEGVPHWLGIAHLATPFAAVMGGLLAGTGMLILFRHRASLGGFNVLVLYLQDTRGWRAGHLQMALDCSIVIAAFWFVPWPQIVWSVLGAMALNLTLAINHRPGRYMAV